MYMSYNGNFVLDTVGSTLLWYVNGKPIVIDDVWLLPGAPESVVLSWSPIEDDKVTFRDFSDPDDDVNQRITIRKGFAGMNQDAMFDRRQVEKLGYINFQRPDVWKSYH
jgi:hypothetical protein